MSCPSVVKRNNSKEELLRMMKNCQELESVLLKSFGKNVYVVSCTSESLLPVGENFASDMVKVNAKIKRDRNSLIENYDFVAKKVLKNVDDLGDWTVIMEREIFMYTQIIPLYKRIELENGAKEDETISENIATLYGYKIIVDPMTQMAGPNSMILLENLKIKGYYIVDKKVGLDIKHAKVAVKALAKFDALGIVAKKKYPDEFAKIKSVAQKQGVYDVQGSEELRKSVVSMISKRFPGYTNVLEKINERHKNNLNWELVTTDTWSTVCHNDFWTNNIMFHADETGNIRGIKFLDFQSYSFSNIFVEIPYFFLTSLDDNSKLHHFDELLDLYYESFVATLRKMNVDLKDFSRSEFDKQLGQDAVHELIHIAVDLLHFTADADQAEDREDLLKKISSFQGNDIFYNKIKHLLKIYERKQWLH